MNDGADGQDDGSETDNQGDAPGSPDAGDDQAAPDGTGNIDLQGSGWEVPPGQGAGDDEETGNGLDSSDEDILRTDINIFGDDDEEETSGPDDQASGTDEGETAETDDEPTGINITVATRPVDDPGIEPTSTDIDDEPEELEPVSIDIGVSLSSDDEDEEETSTADTTTTLPSTHVVQPGESFGKIAIKYYGHAKYADRISRANPSIHPRYLQVGATIKIPPAPEGATRTASPQGSSTATSDQPTPSPVDPERRYVVQPGDTWSTLGSKFYGQSRRWTELYEYNKERVPEDHNYLPAGTVIELPPNATIPAESNQ
jgi:nucleoid-associated protein YgaU